MKHLRPMGLLWAAGVVALAFLFGTGLASILDLRGDFDASQADRSALAQDVEVLRDQLTSLGVEPDVGPAGEPGDQGDQGPRGPTGQDGVDGLNGIDGQDGADGRDGVDGAPGQAGANGVDGAPGPQGPAGEPGATGAQGETGPQGEPGPTCPDGYSPQDRQAIPDETWLVCVSDPQEDP